MLGGAAPAGGPHPRGAPRGAQPLAWRPRTTSGTAAPRRSGPPRPPASGWPSRARPGCARPRAGAASAGAARRRPRRRPRGRPPGRRRGGHRVDVPSIPRRARRARRGGPPGCAGRPSRCPRAARRGRRPPVGEAAQPGLGDDLDRRLEQLGGLFVMVVAALVVLGLTLAFVARPCGRLAPTGSPAGSASRATTCTHHRAPTTPSRCPAGIRPTSGRHA